MTIFDNKFVVSSKSLLSKSTAPGLSGLFDEFKSMRGINDDISLRVSLKPEHMSKTIIIGFVDKGWRMIKAYISITHFSQTFLKLEEAKCQKTSIDYQAIRN